MQKSNVQHNGRRATRPVGPHYKWIALTNTTLGVLMASIDSSIVLISLPAIFNGIHVNPLAPGETDYFLWILLGYMVIAAVHDWPAWCILSRCSYVFRSSPSILLARETLHLSACNKQSRPKRGCTTHTLGSNNKIRIVGIA